MYINYKLSNMDYKELMEWASPRQLEILEALISTNNKTKAAANLGISTSTVSSCVRRVQAKAAKQGYSPKHDMVHTAPDTHIVKGVSSYYDEKGNLSRQWVKTDLKKGAELEAMKAFAEGLAEDLAGKHTISAKPTNTNNELMSCYVIGDHHLGMLAHAAITGGDDYNIDKAESLLVEAFDKLITRGVDASTGLLVNLGDFLHANDLTNTTQSGHVLDVDGHFSRAYKAAGSLLRLIVSMMLAKHEKVVVLNARGNHDRDAALSLNIMMEVLYENDPRVEVLDNVSKFVSYTYGSNLVVTHHGDRMTPQKVYEHVTRTMSKQWGDTTHRFCWMGHIHHKTAREIGGMVVESWNVLSPVDNWHADSGYGSDRSMTCVVLHKEYGEYIRHKVGIKELDVDRLNSFTQGALHGS